jgi:hypothetical protein
MQFLFGMRRMVTGDQSQPLTYRVMFQIGKGREMPCSLAATGFPKRHCAPLKNYYEKFREKFRNADLP